MLTKLNPNVIEDESIPLTKLVRYTNNKIIYSSTDGAVVTPYKSDVFGANIVSNTYENGRGVITFDGDVTQIGIRAFYKCATLTSITIPDSVTSIGERAFRECTSLTSITIPNGVTWIEHYTFCDCSSLASVTIPDSVTWIGQYIFANCTSLTSVTIPNSVTEIGWCAFLNCTSLTSVIVKAITVPTLNSSLPTSVKLYVPSSALEEYTNATNWSDCENIVGSLILDNFTDVLTSVLELEARVS